MLALGPGGSVAQAFVRLPVELGSSTGFLLLAYVVCRPSGECGAGLWSVSTGESGLK